jgi:sialidase-1
MKNIESPFFTDVFVKGEEGYDTFRIPSIITTSSGDLLAFCEARGSLGDVSENDIVMKRSTNCGQTWGPLEVILTDGRNSFNNPAAVVLTTSQKIILCVQKYHFGMKERDAQPGYEGNFVSRCYIIISNDNGKSWSSPKDITISSKRPVFATSIASGPGIGIQLQRGQHKGRIIIPFNQGPWGKWEVYVIFSDDEGETWQMSENVPRTTDRYHGNEVQVVECSDGSILLNARSFGKSNFFAPMCRKSSYSHDGGKTWEAFHEDRTLIESGCQGSIIRYQFPEDKKSSIILFSNPASKILRKNGTIRASFNDGKSWNKSRTLWKEHFAYSCLTVLSNLEIGCLFETGKLKPYDKIVFGSFSLDWILHN